MRRSWCRPVVQFVVADRPPTIAGPALRRVAIRSGSSAMWRRWLASRPLLLRLRQCHAKLSVLVIGQPSLSSAFGEFDDAMHRIVDPKALANGIGEDRTEQCRRCDRRHHDHRARPRDRVAWSSPWPAVLPAATSCMKRSTSFRLTVLTGIRPSKGMMCRAIRPRSEISVDSFLAIFRRVSSRPASTSARYCWHSSATVIALRPAILSASGIGDPWPPRRRTRRASWRAVSGDQGDPCLPIV